MTIQHLITEHLDNWTAADTEKKSGRGRSSGNAASVYGIKKLRELILELAVRGKLVPQDANDEPASELLKRIAAEKAKLVAEGKIKKSKPLAEITDNEKPFDLPVGWEWVFLPDVSEYKVGKTPSTKSSVYWTNSGDGFNWVSIADLNHDGSVFETTKQITDKAVSEVFRYEPAPVGTILMSFKLTLGKISTLEVPAFHNEAIISIYPNQSIFKDYLFKVLPARAMAGNSKSAIKGNTLNSESIAALMIPLPPIAEQHRIVAKVDELMALCDQLENQHNNAAEAHEKLVTHLLGTLTQSQLTNTDAPLCKRGAGGDFNWQRISKHFDSLFTTEASINALKQTLLQLAVMGKLVPQDRNDEPASELLKRIQAEKAKLITEGKIKRAKPLAPITDEEKPFVLPPRWEWVRFQDITKLITDGKHGDCNNSLNSGYFFLSAKDIQNGKLLYENARQIEQTEFQEVHQRTGLESGDICMVNTGATVGKMAIAPDHPFTSKTTFQKSVAIIKIIRPHIDQRYITNFLIAEAPNLLKKSGGSAINNLLLGDLKMKLVPLPSTREQIEIVTKVDELMAICDQLKSRLTAANQLQQKIADVMVEQAI